MDEQLLIRFLTHTCSSEDIRSVDRWIASGKDNADWLFEMERVWSLKDELKYSDKKEVEAAYNQFLSKIQQDEKKEGKAKRFTLSAIAKYAAAILLAGSLVVNFYQMADKPSDAENVIEVPNGQRASLTLSDGTKVQLNSQSVFTYPSRFSGKNRNVKLMGEAFFEVTHNEKAPFSVQSPSLTVKVLGTKFNMKSYCGENAVVSLAEGKVMVESNNPKASVILKPNEQAEYSDAMGLRLIRHVDVNLVKSWTEGEAAFINKSLKEIARNLERKFDVQIDITDQALASEVFTCRFNGSATIEQVLILLKETRRIDYTIEDKHIRIYEPKK